MAGVSKAEVEQARSVDLLSYLQRSDPTELVKRSGGHYSTRTHDSVDISNGKWYRWSTGQCGNDALSYLTYVCGENFIDAVRKINGQEFSKAPAFSVAKVKPQIERRLLLPMLSPEPKIAERYLIHRGIDREIVRTCIDHGYISEDLTDHSVIFFGMDDHNEPKYAGYRSTSGPAVKRDLPGSDKRYSFRFIGGSSDGLHIFESAIDMMSYMSLVKNETDNQWRDGNYISMAGVFAPKGPKLPAALEGILENPDIHRVYIHFDNDEAGRKATIALAEALKQYERFEVFNAPPAAGKDYNDYLRMKNRERGREKELCEWR